MKLPLYGTLLLLATCAHASPTPGLEEYQEALRLEDELSAVYEELESLDREGGLSEADQKRLAASLETASALKDQMQRSADKGFAPAQYKLALFDRYTFDKTGQKKSCNMLRQASDQGLAAAGVGYVSHCLMANWGRIDEVMPELDRHLSNVIEQQDPFLDYYPLLAFSAPRCFPLSETVVSNKKKMTVQQFIDMAPPLLERQAFVAEAHLLRVAASGMSHKGNTIGNPVQDVEAAKQLGCASKRLEGYKEQFTPKP